MHKQTRLLKDLRNIDTNIAILENIINSFKGKKDPSQKRIELASYEKRKEEIESQLMATSSLDLVMTKKNDLIHQIREINRQLDFNKMGQRISRNQGTVINNRIYPLIAETILDCFYLVTGINFIPDFYYEPNSNFKHERLKACLSAMGKELEEAKFTGIIQLKEFVHSKLIAGIKSIMDLDESENQSNIPEFDL